MAVQYWPFRHVLNFITKQEKCNLILPLNLRRPISTPGSAAVPRGARRDARGWPHPDKEQAVRARHALGRAARAAHAARLVAPAYGRPGPAPHRAARRRPLHRRGGQVSALSWSAYLVNNIYQVTVFPLFFAMLHSDAAVCSPVF